MRASWWRHKFRLGRTRGGVPILVHWSVPALSCFLLGLWIEALPAALAGLASYLATIFVHEAGHQWLARHRGCRVIAIEIYPFHARCIYEPYVAFDTIVVAWGGFLAQVIVGLPLAAYVMAFGYTRFEPLNAVLAVVGFLGPAIGALNMIPVAPLDGHRAWRVLPVLFSRLRRRPTKTPQRALTAPEALEEALRKATRR
jgi:Zn-dependent protease